MSKNPLLALLAGLIVLGGVVAMVFMEDPPIDDPMTDEIPASTSSDPVQESAPEKLPVATISSWHAAD